MFPNTEGNNGRHCTVRTHTGEFYFISARNADLLTRIALFIPRSCEFSRRGGNRSFE